MITTIIGNSVNSFWNGTGRWRGYRFTGFFAFSGLAKAFLDNYWVFTSMPLAEDTHSTSGKTFYMLAQVLFTLVIALGTGLILDYLRSIYETERGTDIALISRN